MWDTALLWDGGVLRYYVEIGGATAQQTDRHLPRHARGRAAATLIRSAP